MRVVSDAVDQCRFFLGTERSNLDIGVDPSPIACLDGCGGGEAELELCNVIFEFER